MNWDYTNISMASNDKFKCMCTCASLHLFFLSLILIIFCIILCIIIHRLDYTKIYTIQENWKKDAFFNCDVRWKKQATLIQSKGTHEKQKKKIKNEISLAAAGLSNYEAHSRNTHRTKPTKSMHIMTVVKWNTPFQMHPRYIIIHALS